MFGDFLLIVGFFLCGRLNLADFVLEFINGRVVFVGKFFDIFLFLLDSLLLGFPIAVFLHFVGISAFKVALTLFFPSLVLFALIAFGSFGVI